MALTEQEKLERRRAYDTAWHRAKRQSLTAEERRAYNAKHAEYHRAHYRRLTPDQKQARFDRQYARFSEAIRRGDESTVERLRMAQSKRNARQRARMTESQKAQRRRKAVINTKKRLKTNPEKKAIAYLSWRLRDLLHGRSKSDRTRQLVGEDVVERLQAKFSAGMDWRNYGKVWHIDHIIPCMWFSLDRSDHQAACFHNSNLRPLGVSANVRRQSRACLEDAQEVLRSCPEENRKVIEQVIGLIKQHPLASRKRHITQ